MTNVRYGEYFCLQLRAMCVCLCKKCVCNFEGCVFALLSGERETVKALIVFSWLEPVCLPGWPAACMIQTSKQPFTFLRDLWATFENQYFCFGAKNIGFWTSLTCTALKALTIIAINSRYYNHTQEEVYALVQLFVIH